MANGADCISVSRNAAECLQAFPIGQVRVSDAAADVDDSSGGRPRPVQATWWDFPFRPGHQAPAIEQSFFIPPHGHAAAFVGPLPGALFQLL